MTETEYASMLDEIERLLNDPDVPMQPARVWSLLAEISHRDVPHGDVPHASASGSRPGPTAHRPARSR